LVGLAFGAVVARKAIAEIVLVARVGPSATQGVRVQSMEIVATSSGQCARES
jgi:hypothetical protein